jgi:hypothetical protein
MARQPGENREQRPGEGGHPPGASSRSRPLPAARWPASSSRWPGRPAALPRRARDRRAGLPGDRPVRRAAFFPGSSAPDAVLHGLHGVGQAACVDAAAAADRLRRADLLQRRTRRRDGEKQLGILALAGTPRHPAQGSRTGIYRQHGKPPAGRRRCWEQAPIPVMRLRSPGRRLRVSAISRPIAGGGGVRYSEPLPASARCCNRTGLAEPGDIADRPFQPGDGPGRTWAAATLGAFHTSGSTWIGHRGLEQLKQCDEDRPR